MTNANRNLQIAGPALALVLCAGMTPAAAQTLITREPSQAQSTTVERTIVRERIAPPARGVKSERKATVTKAAPRATIRTTTHERIVTSPAPVRERIMAPAPRTVVTGGALELTPAERAVVYRTIVERPMQRDIVVTDPLPRVPMATQRIVTSPDRRPLVTAEPELDDEVVVPSPPATRRILTGPETTGMAVPSERVELVVGARVPRSVPLYDPPASAITAAPAIGQYRYALIEDRVYLVDPNDGVVVAELYR